MGAVKTDSQGAIITLQIISRKHDEETTYSSW